MRIIRLSCLAATAAAILAAPATAAERLLLEPASPWQLREYEDRCRASREFGEGEQRTTLWIEQGGLEPIYNVTLIGQPLRNPYGAGIHVRFGENPEFIRSYIAAESSKGRPVLTMYGVTVRQPKMQRDGDEEAPDLGFDIGDANAITTLDLRTSIRQPIRLAIGPMLETFGVLGLCGAKLSGILSEAGRPLTGEAKPPVAIKPDSWLTAVDYPGWLARAQMEGRVTVRLTVDREGRASSCFVTESNKPQLFDDAVCLGLMKRARFEPARNAAGEPVASYYFHGISFTMS
ncbi:energy transducer TonB [Porphyrobacter sp. CACIAM 03H1]|uniref:energy transducer TonB n=1 Tax=Porphyrobacter sp. CACIAM 03H1 TaxID=2003315 RepID=UPI0012FD46C4|nr:TonB family protein [Porphyrobacter sp. CACIAM 03H1]